MKQLADEGMTMVVVTHEMGFAREVGSRVLFMDGGKILEQEQPQAFFSNPTHPRTQLFLSKVLYAQKGAPLSFDSGALPPFQMVCRAVQKSVVWAPAVSRRIPGEGPS